MKITVLKNQIVKNILSALAVAGFGFILLNITFLFFALLTRLVSLLFPANFAATSQWFMPVMLIIFVVIIGLISWFVFKSKLGVLYKAIYMTVPLAVIFVPIGMFLGSLPVVPYLVGGLFAIGVLYFFYRTKQPWLYYYTLILVSLVMLIVGLLGIEI
jgi:hypothetical protein